MIDGLKPYPAMKDSGAAWLEALSEHWEVLPNRAIFSEQKATGFPNEEMLSVTINQGVIRQSSLLSESSKKDSSNEDKSKYKLVCPCDIAYDKMRAWQGAIGVSRLRGIVSPAYIVVRPRDRRIASYFHYLLRAPAFAIEAERWSYGISSDQWSLPPEQFKQIYCCVPPLDEQCGIARFLDHADRLIRRYINAKRKLIKLLEEQKQAIIHRAVTRGLDPNVRLKPSGIEWLGDIPADWKIIVLGRCLKRIEQGWSPIAAEGELADEQWAVLALSAVKRGRFNSRAIKPISMTADIPTELEVKPGDFLMARLNTRKLVGDVCIVDKIRPRTIMSDLIYRLHLDASIIQLRLLMYQLLCPVGRQQIERDARGSSGTMLKIGQSHIRAWRVILPPRSEQATIVRQLDRSVAHVDHAVISAEREIDLIEEYRTCLIADVVTGKLDVRAAAGALPELPREEIAGSDDLEVEPDEAEPEEAAA